MADGTKRADIRSGIEVNIVLKEDQDTGDVVTIFHTHPSKTLSTHFIL
jgi:uncharacterized repeat protein (TIGR03833 family)